MQGPALPCQSPPNRFSRKRNPPLTTTYNFNLTDSKSTSLLIFKNVATVTTQIKNNAYQKYQICLIHCIPTSMAWLYNAWALILWLKPQFLIRFWQNRKIRRTGRVSERVSQNIISFVICLERKKNQTSVGCRAIPGLFYIILSLLASSFDRIFQIIISMLWAIL